MKIHAVPPVSTTNVTVTFCAGVSGPEFRAAVNGCREYPPELRHALTSIPLTEGSEECRDHVIASHLAAFQSGESFRTPPGVDPFSMS
ncbi:hypothetical protein [Dietzia timorensis]|uniref:Uncharacterized protein n=1 Tax=Dietzia timorensis TaxID=499555 RepID=A0A173LHL5_9ACTN|nr:hypothetical protein [Dietzia timorensis]ANI91259.1 Hypothetical protein BJL86_0452 [Dietzia timorensis]